MSPPAARGSKRLPRPGPVGRIVRLGFGGICLWYVFDLIEVFNSLIAADGNIRSIIWNGVIVGLFLISYVINIGFSRAWKKWPAIVSVGIFLIISAFGYLASENFETIGLARTMWTWEVYLFSHLGSAFMISALIGTPGCEMRAVHDLFSRLSGIPTREHHCPVGPLDPIDRWELGQSWLKNKA